MINMTILGTWAIHAFFRFGNLLTKVNQVLLQFTHGQSQIPSLETHVYGTTLGLSVLEKTQLDSLCKVGKSEFANCLELSCG